MKMDSIMKLIGGMATPTFDILALAGHLNTCRVACTSSHATLSSQEQKYIDEIMKEAILFYNYLLKKVPIIVKDIKSVDAISLLKLIKITTRIVNSAKTARLLKKYVELYTEIAKTPKRLAAIASFVKCMLARIPIEYKKVLLAMLELCSSLTSLLSNDDVRESAKVIGAAVNKHVVRPIHRDIKK